MKLNNNNNIIELFYILLLKRISNILEIIYNNVFK